MMSYRCKQSYKLLRDVKYAFPKLKIVAGGPLRDYPLYSSQDAGQKTELFFYQLKQ